MVMFSQMKSSTLIESLTSGYTKIIRDPLWGDIPLKGGILDIINSRAFQKLGRIKQTGPAYLVFPGAVHTRLNHSLGVYHLLRKILLSLSDKTESMPLSGICSLNSALIGALLHDLGHFPYAHSLKELLPKEHEERAFEIIMDDKELQKLIRNAGGDPIAVGLIIAKDHPLDSIKECSISNEEITLYRNLLSGTLDPDKLDYLSRDAFFAGIPYGIQDTEMIINSLSLIDNRIAVKKDSLYLVDQVLFSKYMMYKSLYWNDGVRSATSMIKKAVISACDINALDLDDIYNLDDAEFFTLLVEKRDRCEALSLSERVKNNDILRIKAKGDTERLSDEKKEIKNRAKYESNVYKILKGKYPELSEYEVIIDIPEPIHFESDVDVAIENGSSRAISKDETLFKGDTSKEFVKMLRKTSLFVPDYIDERDAKEALREGFYNE